MWLSDLTQGSLKDMGVPVHDTAHRGHSGHLGVLLSPHIIKMKCCGVGSQGTQVAELGRQGRGPPAPRRGLLAPERRVAMLQGPSPSVCRDLLQQLWDVDLGRSRQAEPGGGTNPLSTLYSVLLGASFLPWFLLFEG